jgi:hypothetical protein
MKTYVVVLIFMSLFIRNAYGADYESVSAVINHYKSQIVNIKDLDTEEQDYFIKSEKKKTPGIIKADFNGDGKEDVALLTKKELLLFICTEQCKLIKRVDYGGFSGYQYIVPINKGQLIEEFGGDEDKPPLPPVRLKNAAIHLIYFGKASIAYYWDTKKNNFKKLVTGD